MDNTTTGPHGLSRRGLIGASILMGGAATLGIARPSAAAANAPGYGIGDQTPHLLAHAHTGRRVPLASFRGRAVLLEFGAVWCHPCEVAALEIPSVRAELDQAGRHRPVAFVTALVQDVQARPATRADAARWDDHFSSADVVLHPNGDSDDPLMKSFWEGYGLTGAHLFDHPHNVAFPTWVGISPSGTIVGYHEGWHRDAIIALGQEALA